MRKELISKGYMVEAKHVGADYVNTGVNLPLGMAFVLTKNGEPVSTHRSHVAAWSWADRLEGQIIPAA